MKKVDVEDRTSVRTRIVKETGYTPWPKKSLASSLPDMKKVDVEDRTSVRTRIAKETGYTGLLILHRLHHLYGFNVLHNIVYDAMHIIPLIIT